MAGLFPRKVKVSDTKEVSTSNRPAKRPFRVATGGLNISILSNTDLCLTAQI